MTTELTRGELGELSDGEREALQRGLFLVESTCSPTQWSGGPPTHGYFYCGP